jgi:LmbE family N-acetylglucosaminyl deacetylase
MATIVSFHAHPDDESIATGGTLARAAAEGHRVVVVFATGGELGEVAEGFLDAGEELGARRAQETARSMEVLGVHRHLFLGYRDSGMAGEPSNDDPACFWQADVEQAAVRLAEVLREERAEVLTVYDDHGNYGHPDHVQVHRVGVRAAELAATPHVLESTMNRDHIRRLMEQAAAEGEAPVDDADGPTQEEMAAIGSPESVITTRIDVSAHMAQKRASMAAHTSQIPADSWFLTLPDDQFTAAFGLEWYIRRGEPVAGSDDWLLPPATHQDGR